MYRSWLPPYPPPRLGHQKGRGLLSPSIPSRSLGGSKRLQDPLRERAAGLLERFGHGRDHPFGGHDVPLAGVTVTNDRRGVREAFPPGERGAPAGGVNHAHLPRFSLGICLQQAVQGGLGVQPPGQEVEAPGPERNLGERLGGHGTHATPSPRHQGPHRQELRLDADADLVRLGSGGHDRERHGATV